jgi:hypothetical protein
MCQSALQSSVTGGAVTKELKDVIWTWLPGFVAGLVPLVVFLLVSSQVSDVVVPKDHIPVHHYLDGWIGHLLVLGMVTSAVSTFTAFPRLFAQRGASPDAGLGLLVVMTLTLVVSVAFYVLFEARLSQSHMIYWALFVAGLAWICSFYVELAIANVSLIRKRDRDAAAKPEINQA